MPVQVRKAQRRYAYAERRPPLRGPCRAAHMAGIISAVKQGNIGNSDKFRRLRCRQKGLEVARKHPEKLRRAQEKGTRHSIYGWQAKQRAQQEAADLPCCPRGSSHRGAGQHLAATHQVLAGAIARVTRRTAPGTSPSNRNKSSRRTASETHANRCLHDAVQGGTKDLFCSTCARQATPLAVADRIGVPAPSEIGSPRGDVPVMLTAAPRKIATNRACWHCGRTL